MFKARVVLLSLLATLSVSALTSAEAVAAHNFKIEGKEIVENTEVNVEGGQSIFATTIAGTKVEINCEEIEGPSKSNVLEKEGKSKFELNYKGCTLFSVAQVEKGKVERLDLCKIKEPLTLKGGGLLKGTAGMAENEFKGTEEGEKLGTMTIEGAGKETCSLAGSYPWFGFWFQEWYYPWTWTWHYQWTDFYWWQFWHVTLSTKTGEPVFARGSMHTTLANGKPWSIE